MKNGFPHTHAALNSGEADYLDSPEGAGDHGQPGKKGSRDQSRK